MLKYPKVLLLSSGAAEADVLQETLSEHVILTRAKNMHELQVLLESGNYDVLFCSRSFREGIWDDALAEIQQRYPNIAIIILSRVAGEEEWIKALAAGAFDLLIPPYEQRTLLAVLEHATASRDARVIRNIAV